MSAAGIIFSNIHDANIPELTRNRTMASVPFGCRYRLIDFTLSNCVNSGIDTVGVLTQYRPLELNSYIGNGQPWDLDRMYGGVYILCFYPYCHHPFFRINSTLIGGSVSSSDEAKPFIPSLLVLI